MRRTQSLGILVAALGILTLSGCGDDDPAPEARPSTSSPSDDGSSPADTPTEEETVAPSSGEPLALDHAFVRAPEGWATEDQGLGLLSASHPEGYGGVYLSDFGTVTAGSLREFVRTTELSQFRTGPELDFDSELGGERAYHASAHEPPFFLEEYGALRGGVAVTLSFELDELLPARERRRIVESVVASFTWQ